MEIKKSQGYKRWLMLILTGIIVFVVLYVSLNNLSALITQLKNFFGLFLPLITGGCVAFVLNVPARALCNLFTKLQKKAKKGKGKVYPKFNSVISIVITILGVILLLYFIISMVIPQIYESLISIFELIKKKFPEIVAFLEGYGIDTKTFRGIMEKIDFNEIVQRLTSSVDTIVQTTVNAASSVISGIFNTVTSIIFAIYILSNKNKLKHQCKMVTYAFFKEKTADKICYVANLTSKTFSNFISGQCLDAVILGIMFFIVLSLFGFPYAGVISVTIGALALIPYAGAFLGCAIGALLILMVDPMKALLFVVIFLILQQVEGQLVYPKVVGGSVGLPPIWTLTAALVGAGLFGVAGMLFFIPMFSVIYTLFRQHVYSRLSEKEIML